MRPSCDGRWASTGASSARPSKVLSSSRLTRSRSLAATQAWIERGAFSGKSLANGALVRRIAPLRSTVAMASGVLLKKRAKRTSAARSVSETSAPWLRSSTSVRELPGRPSLSKASLCISRTGIVWPLRRTRSRSIVSERTSPGAGETWRISAAPSPDTMSSSLSRAVSVSARS